MKHLLLSVLLTAGFSAWAHPHHQRIQAEGHVVYQNGDTLGSKKVILYGPKGHHGRFVLEVDGKKVKSHSAHIRHERFGRKTLKLVFLNVPGAPKGMAALMKGTIMKGKNKAVYFGDFFTRRTSDCSGSCKTGSCDAGGCCDPKAGCKDGSCDAGGCCDSKAGCKDGSCDSGACHKKCQEGECTDGACASGGCKHACTDGSDCCACPSKEWRHGGGFYFEAAAEQLEQSTNQ